MIQKQEAEEESLAFCVYSKISVRGSLLKKIKKSLYGEETWLILGFIKVKKHPGTSKLATKEQKISL